MRELSFKKDKESECDVAASRVAAGRAGRAVRAERFASSARCWPPSRSTRRACGAWRGTSPARSSHLPETTPPFASGKVSTAHTPSFLSFLSPKSVYSTLFIWVISPKGADSNNQDSVRINRLLRFLISP